MRKNVNLLPPLLQKQVKNSQINKRVMVFGMWLILSAIVTAGVLFATNLLLTEQLKSTEVAVAERTDDLRDLEQAFLQEDIQELNETLKNFDQLLINRHKWSGVFVEIAQILPTNIRVDSVELDRETGKVKMSGFAQSRDSVLQFRKNILASNIFMNVDFPLANLESANNLDWSYEFFVDLKKVADEE